MPSSSYRADMQLYVESFVSATDHKPYVMFQLGDKKAQLDTDKAMEFALHIQEAVEGAISDAFLFNFFQAKMNLPEEQCQTLIMEFREYRETFPVVRGWFHTDPSRK